METQEDLYALLSEAHEFPNQDQKLWWHSTGPMFAKMLSTFNYDLDAQQTHLSNYISRVIPFLGVYPTNDKKRWMSILTRYGTPFELSLNCSNSVVRYTYEPISEKTGTDADPYNTHAIWDALEEFKSINPKVNDETFRHFKKCLALNERESRYLRANNLVGEDIRTQNKLALDLDGDDFSMKAYFYPALKSIATGKSIPELIFDSARQLAERNPDIAPSLAMLEEYSNSRSGTGSTAVPRLLSCDIVDPSKSRVKIYISEQIVSLAAMEDLWTLGGRRNDQDSKDGFELVRELWDLLKVPEGVRSYPDGYLKLGERAPEFLPSMANYTLTPRETAPEPQIYFSTFGMNDMAICDALATFFARHGWWDMAAKYKEGIRAYYPNETDETFDYVHAYISFSYRKQKPYLSVYLQTFETGNWQALHLS